jgi:hypothetical protein
MAIIMCIRIPTISIRRDRRNSGSVNTVLQCRCNPPPFRPPFFLLERSPGEGAARHPINSEGDFVDLFERYFEGRLGHHLLSNNHRGHKDKESYKSLAKLHQQSGFDIGRTVRPGFCR